MLKRYQSFGARTWENMQVTAIHREEMHATWGAYADVASALTQDRSTSPNILALNGTWSFMLCDNPDTIPDGFYMPAFDLSRWASIEVPGSWELQGFGTPVYTATRYPFDSKGDSTCRLQTAQSSDAEIDAGLRPPYVPMENPTGCYVRVFDLPEGWLEKQLFIELDAVESAYYLWINGRRVGYATDSRLPSHFNITQYLQAGQNTIALQVMKYSAWTYMESQDQWYLGGIHRGIRLIAKPIVHLRDWRIQAGGDGRLTAWCAVNDADDLQDYRVKIQLYDDETSIYEAEAPIDMLTPLAHEFPSPEARSALFDTLIPTIQPWSEETPKLYMLVFSLTGPDGELDFESTRIGFRTITIDGDGVLRLNGTRLVLRGIGRSEFNAKTGYTLTRERIHEELSLIKRLHFNAIRATHAPNDPDFYEVCDELGLYVIDEANVDTRGLQASLSMASGWSAAFLERIARMVLRDKNHTCVLFWSLGGISGAGCNQGAMAGWVRVYDPTRPIFYESGQPGYAMSDVRAVANVTSERLAEILADREDHRPVILSEYGASPLGAVGHAQTLWEMVWRYPQLQGGFLWQFMDRAIWNQSRECYLLSGDFSEKVVDILPERCLGGIVSPDLTVYPAALEIMHVQSPIQIETIEAGGGWIRVYNHYLTLDLSHVLVEWEISADGRSLGRHVAELPPLAAGEHVEIQLPVVQPELLPGVEYYLNITCSLRDDWQWAKIGHVLYTAQFPTYWQSPRALMSLVRPSNALVVEKRTYGWHIRGDGWQVFMDEAMGTLRSLEVDGRPVMHQGPVEAFYRAPSFMDLCNGAPDSFAAQWRAHGLDRLTRTLENVQAQITQTQAVFVVRSYFAGLLMGEGFDSELTYRICATGIEVRHRVDAHFNLPTIPRIGLAFTLPETVDSLVYLGRGSHDNYADRMVSAQIGLYAKRVDDTPCPYTVPVENDGHEEVRRLSIADEHKRGLAFLAFQPVHFDAHRYTVADLDAARHRDELPTRDRITLHIDAHHAGVGGAGQQPVREPYWVRPGRYEYSLEMLPVQFD